MSADAANATVAPAALVANAARYYGDRQARMVRNLETCLRHLPAHHPITSCPSSSVLILEGLQARGLSRKSIRAYHTAFLRALALVGISTARHPLSATPPRTARPLLPREMAKSIIAQLLLSHLPSHRATGRVASLCLHAGLRASVEGMTEGAWHWDGPPKAGGSRIMLVDCGKGGHTRCILVVDPATIAIPGPVVSISYRTAARVWASAVARELPVNERLDVPTLHSLRHLFASFIKQRTGDIMVARDMLGHRSLTTTEIYVHNAHDIQSYAKDLTE